MSNNEQLTQIQEIAQSAFNAAPGLYANGFLNGVGLTDSYIIFQTNGPTTADINITLSTAKTLGKNLTDMVSAYETETGNAIPTLDELGGG